MDEPISDLRPIEVALVGDGLVTWNWTLVQTQIRIQVLHL